MTEEERNKPIARPEYSFIVIEAIVLAAFAVTSSLLLIIGSYPATQHFRRILIAIEVLTLVVMILGPLLYFPINGSKNYLVHISLTMAIFVISHLIFGHPL